MKKILLLSFLVAHHLVTKGQGFTANQLLGMLDLTLAKLEIKLTNKRYNPEAPVVSGDTSVIIYSYSPIAKGGNKKRTDATGRKFLRSVLKETFTHTYQTTSAAEYTAIINELKKDEFYCDYEKDSTLHPPSYLYQHEDYTAEASVIKHDSTTWYSIVFYKKSLPVDSDLHFAEDLLEFTSHEYLVYYFGAHNVKKDIFYFAGNDIVSCSVLFINTSRQVIFIWKDEINRRKIDNLLIGGQHKLKSQQDNAKFFADNSWKLKSKVHAGMPLFELRTLNEQNFAFCGGNAANPGLIFPESTGKIDFENAGVILGCMNCDDENFMNSKMIYADKAMNDGRVLFVLTIALYPKQTGIFD
jgi:hypothetical protein